jgi:hypothetical protein
MPQARRIFESVGDGGRNRARDVIIIQRLLNSARKRHARFAAAIPKALVIDGDCGDRTREAIRAYQSVVLGWTGRDVDGKVSPKRRTWHSLNGNVGGSAAPMCKDLPRAQLLAGYRVFRQGDYAGATLGSGSLMMPGHGCALCTLTMAATAIGSPTEHWRGDLSPGELTPLLSNEIIKRAGGFSGSALVMPLAAAALGMSYLEFGRTEALRPSDVGFIDSSLYAGFPVAAHVDYKRNEASGHWILIVQRNGDGTFVAIDPATGRALRLTRSPMSSVETQRSQPKAAAVARGVLFGLGEGGSPNQQRYVVVRFGLLAPSGGGHSGGF